MSRVRSTLWRLERHRSRLGDTAFLKRLLPAEQVGTNEAEELLAEARSAPELAAAVSSAAAQAWAAWGGQPAADGEAGARYAVEARLDRARTLLLYATLRILRPDVVIETGCFTGWDSAIMLLALARNGSGRLHTIDLPGYAERDSEAHFQASLSHGGLPPELAPGFLVPDELRDRWSLELGDARDLLPRLLRDISAPVDVFFHDSEHSYGHMMWEYTSVVPHLSPRNGLLVSDDLSFNTAFWDFCSGIGRPVVMHRRNANLGAMTCSPSGRTSSAPA